MTNPLHETLFARHEGAATPFLHGPDGSVVTHDAFLRLAARMARALASLGVVPGDRVALQAEKSVEALAVYAACVRAGAVFLPLNTAYTPVEIAYFVEDSGAALLIAAPARQETLRPVAEARGAAFQTLDGPSGSFFDLASRERPEFTPTPRTADDLAALLYTSGTTGRSKGAMLTGENLRSNALVLAETWRFTSDDVLLHALPIFHTHGLFVATNVTLVAGGSMLFLPKFDAGEVIRLLPRATAMMGVPTFYTRLLDEPGFDRDRTAHMRLFVSGSAPLLAETHRAFSERTGHRILERYGMTETGMSTSNPFEGERRAGTVGFPLPGVELRVTDPQSGAELPAGEIGVLEVRGPNVFGGYWRMPERTAEELRPEGWFVTGDLGLVDAGGYVSIVGRNKDLIISGGFNIYPKEVELLLDDQPGVKESAVIGVPHPDFGEGVVAILVPEGPGPDLGAIGEALARSLARYKQPKRFEILPELPRNTMGKVQKAALRERFAEAFR